MAVPHGWLNADIGSLEPGQEVTLTDGTVADVEILGGLDACVVWRRRPGEPQPQAPAGVRLELLGERPRILLRAGRASSRPGTRRSSPS